MPYIGSAPTKVVSRQSATVYRYTATAGQTVFSGADLDNAVLACNPADMVVHMNGIRLESTDYTATSTSVTLVVAAAAGDEVTVTSFQTFEVADTYDKATADTRYVNASGDTITGDLSVTGGDVGINTSSQRTKLAIQTANSSTPQEALNLHNPNTVNGSGTQITFSGFGTETQFPTWRYAGITGAYDTTSSGLNGGGWGGQLKFFVNRGGAADQFEDVLKISGGGHVTMPHQPAFKAGRNSNYTAGGGSDIVFNDDSTSGNFNIGGYYSTSNGRFTAPIAGRYLFYAQVIYGPNTPNGQALDDAFSFYKNGSRVGFSARRAEYVDGTTGNSGYYVDHGSLLQNLSASDYITVNNRFTLSVHGNTTYCIFYGYLLG